MIKKFKLFGIFNIVDLIIISILLIAVIALFLISSNKFSPSPNVEQQRKNVEIDVVLRGKKISRKGEIFKAGDKTFITIRNVPYTKLDIIKSIRTAEKMAIPDPKNPYRTIAVENPVRIYTYNYLVTVRDKAVITSDGPVVGGNKIKIGLPIILEGYDYRLSGVVSDVRIEKTGQKK